MPPLKFPFPQAVTHEGPIAALDGWAAEFVVKRMRTSGPCGTSVLFGTAQFAIVLGRSDGLASGEQHGKVLEKGVWMAELKEGGSGVEKWWHFGQDSELCEGEWAMLTLVCCNGVMSLYIDGCKVGMVARALPLGITSVGFCKSVDGDGTMSGSVREGRVFRGDRQVLEMKKWMQGGERDEVGLVARWEFWATGRVVASNHQGCSGMLEGGESKNAMANSAMEEAHWLWKFIASANGVAATMATSLVRGNEATEVEAACSRWLDSQLFARGVDRAPTGRPLSRLATPDLGFEASPSLEGEPAPMSLAGEEEVETLDSLLQRKLGVRMSPVLDMLERGVISAILHQLGVLPRIISTGHNIKSPSPRPLGLEAAVQSASMAARGVRRHVGELLDISNHSLKEGEEPKPWETFTEPILARARLLLSLPPLCSDAGEGAEEDASIGGEVYRRMWSLAHGNSDMKKAIGLCVEFLQQESVTEEVMSRGLRARVDRAGEVEAGLQALTTLLGSSGDGDISKTVESGMVCDVLEVLGGAHNADTCSMSVIKSSGEEAEFRVRRSLSRLLERLVSVMASSKARVKVLAPAAAALTVALDGADMATVHRAGLMDLISSYFREGGQGWAASQRLHSSLITLLRCLVLQIGVQQHQAVGLSDEVVDSIIGCARSAAVSLVSAEHSSGGQRQEYWAGFLTVLGGLLEGDNEVQNSKVDTRELSFRIRRADPLGVGVTGTAKVGNGKKTHGYEFDVSGSFHGQHVSLVLTPAKHVPANALRSSRVKTLHLNGVIDDGWRASGDVFGGGTWALYRAKDDGGGEWGDYKVLRSSKNAVSVMGRCVHCIGGLLTTHGVLQLDGRVSPDNSWCQIMVVESTSTVATVALGIAVGDYPLDQMPGWQQGSIAYHLDDGHLFEECGFPIEFGQTCARGDIVTCKVNFSEDRRPFSITWLKNGTLVGTRTLGGSLPFKKLYFSLGIYSSGERVLVRQGGAGEGSKDFKPVCAEMGDNQGEMGLMWSKWSKEEGGQGCDDGGSEEWQSEEGCQIPRFLYEGGGATCFHPLSVDHTISVKAKFTLLSADACVALSLMPDLWGGAPTVVFWAGKDLQQRCQLVSVNGSFSTSRPLNDGLGDVFGEKAQNMGEAGVLGSTGLEFDVEAIFHCGLLVCKSNGSAVRTVSFLDLADTTRNDACFAGDFILDPNNTL